MLTKKIKIPKNYNIYVFFLRKEKYIILKNEITKNCFYLKIPLLLSIKKDKEFLKTSTDLTSIFKYNVVIENFFNLCKIPYKKTLLKKGLGFKITLQDSQLTFKLGYSHLISILVNLKKYNVIIGKNFISLISYYKIDLGNICENIYRLKKMDCYKGRGLHIKNKKFVFKLIKKN